MVAVQARAKRIRAALTPSEWSRVGGMAGTVIVLHVLGGGMLAAALSAFSHEARRCADAAAGKPRYLCSRRALAGRRALSPNT